MYLPLALILTSVGLNSGDELVSVAVIYRHGDRTPIKPYRNDPYRNSSYWPVDFGQLTNIGKRQQLELGQWLRDRYSDFLPKSYNEKDVYVRSSDVDRTLMSAQTNLAGLYPPIENQIWDQDLLWQPIPIHAIPANHDAIVAMQKPCDRYNYLFEALLESDEFVQIQERNRALYDYLTENAGQRVDSIEQIEYLYNNLFIEELYNLTLPDWTKSVYPERLKPWAEFSFAVACYTKELARFKVGPLFDEILEHFRNASGAVESRFRRKLMMYSGHDTTISNVLKSLGAFERHCPPYASTILFELKRNGSYYVNVYYKNSSVPTKIVLDGCDFDCPLGKFRKILGEFSLDHAQWAEECELRLLGLLPYNFDIIAFSVVSFILLVIFVGIIVIVCVNRTVVQHSYLRLPDDERV